MDIAQRPFLMHLTKILLIRFSFQSFRDVDRIRSAVSMQSGGLFCDLHHSRQCSRVGTWDALSFKAVPLDLCAAAL